MFQISAQKYFIIMRKHNNYKNRLSPNTCFGIYVIPNRNVDFGFLLYLHDNFSYTHIT